MTTTTAPMTVAALTVQEQRLEYDPWLGMWYACTTDRKGNVKRRWFESQETAQKWLDSQRGK